MANLLDYATLSALVYKDARPLDSNKTPLPTGWAEIAYDTGNGISGFTAGAYQNTLTNEIVIEIGDSAKSGTVYSFLVLSRVCVPVFQRHKKSRPGFPEWLFSFLET